jgi:hypothetical protein
VPAARKSTLRAVTPEDAPRPKLSVEAAAASGDHRALLVAMRERIAKAVSSADCPPRDLAALTRRLQDIAKEIEAIDLRAKEEGADANDVASAEVWDPEAL